MDEGAAKGLCIFLLFIDTLIFGWPPYFLVTGQWLSDRALQIKDIAISYLNCFAGGVFMGACLLHMMAEGREDMEDYFEKVDYDADFPIYETLASFGFFFIAAVEIVAHKFLHNDNTHEEHGHQLRHVRDEQPGTNGVRSVQANGKRGVDNLNYTQDEAATGDQGRSIVPDADNYRVMRTDSTASHDHRQHDHGGEMAMAMKSMESDPLRAFLLLAALSFHTVFDGLAVGLRDSASDVWEMFTAICIHKSLVALCLGTQLFMAFKEKPIRAFAWVFFFSLIAPIGVGIGMYLTEGHGDDLAKDLTNWILQALATGTFLYVTFFEILRDELTNNAGLLKLLAVMLGFGGMAVAKLLDAD